MLGGQRIEYRIGEHIGSRDLSSGPRFDTVFRVRRLWEKFQERVI